MQSQIQAHPRPTVHKSSPVTQSCCTRITQSTSGILFIRLTRFRTIDPPESLPPLESRPRFQMDKDTSHGLQSRAVSEANSSIAGERDICDIIFITHLESTPPW